MVLGVSPSGFGASTFIQSFARNRFRLPDHPFQFLRARVGAIGFRDIGENLQKPIRRHFAGERTRREPFGKGRRARGQPQGWTGLLQLDGGTKWHQPLVLAIITRLRNAETGAHGRNRAFAIRIGFDDVKRVAGFRRADFRRIDLVVAELFLGKLMFRVADLISI